MKLTKIWLTGLALSLALSLAAQTPLQDTIPETVVTATDTSHLLKDVPVQTEVITRQMLQNYAGRSLEDILGGLGNSYILILIDGKRIHGDVGGENDLSLVDPQNIEKIEIVKGASSALYGSDAIAGVINTITRKHREEGLLLENGTRNGSYNDLLAQLKPGDKAALLLVHFGTTYAETQARTIDAINAKARETFPQLTVAEAWTSRIILRKLKGRGIAKQTPLEALLRLRAEGYTHVVVQSTTLLDGAEMESLRRDVAAVEGFFKEIRVGTPLLYSVEDCARVADILAARHAAAADAKKKAHVVLVGHGTYTSATATYSQMDYLLKADGHPLFHVATLEGYPTYETTLAALKAEKARKVTLVPFLFVAGDHATNDIATDWKEALEAEGLQVECVLEGLGEIPEIQDIYIGHIRHSLHHAPVDIMKKKQDYAAGKE